MLTLRVVIAGQDSPLPLTFSPDATLHTLSATLFAQHRPDIVAGKHRLRFISSGKMLSLTSTKLTDLGLSNNSFIHCVVSDIPPCPPQPPPPPSCSPPPITSSSTTNPTAAVMPPPPPTTWHTHFHSSPSHTAVPVHTPAAPDPHSMVSIDLGRDPLLDETAPLAAVSRAAAPTYGADPDSAAASFPSSLHSDLASSTPSGTTARAQDATSAGVGVIPSFHFGDEDEEEDGSIYDWLSGFVLGLLLGLIMMVLAMDRSIALSRKWKKGIGCGAIANVLFGIYLLATDHST